MNNREKINEQVVRLEEWFGKKLNTEQAKAFIDHISFIPVNALKDIVTGYIDENMPMSSKFPTPNKIKDLWFNWRNAHPGQAQHKTITPCKKCNASGFVHYQKHEWLNRYEYVFLCPDCENWENHVGRKSMIPFGDEGRIFAMGFEPIRY